MGTDWPLVVMAVGRTSAPGLLWAQMVLPGPGRQAADPQCRRWGLLSWLHWRLRLPLVWGGVWGWAWLITGGTRRALATGVDSAVWRPEINDPADGEIGEHLRVGASKAGR